MEIIIKNGYFEYRRRGKDPIQKHTFEYVLMLIEKDQKQKKDNEIKEVEYINKKQIDLFGYIKNKKK